VTGSCSTAAESCAAARTDATFTFSTGLRNIYDVALDDELNVFVRDNENDGGDYKIRVCHSFFGADHGYPYLYYERPDEALTPLADLGLGSSAGGVAYLERQFPPEYRGNLFFCEWGRAVMRYAPQRAGSGFAPIKEIEFAAGADNDPYGFKPTDLVVDRDGSLLIADWCDGQRPKRGRGRIYRIRYVGESKATNTREGEASANLPESPTLAVRIFRLTNYPPRRLAALESPTLAVGIFRFANYPPRRLAALESPTLAVRIVGLGGEYAPNRTFPTASVGDFVLWRGRVISLPTEESPRQAWGISADFAQLDSESYYERVAAQLAIERDADAAIEKLRQVMRDGQLGVFGRMHAVWAIAHARGRNAIGDLLTVARSDPDPRVRVQAVRAIADLTDPVLARHRLEVERGDAVLAKQLAELAADADPRLILEVMIAAGRLRWAEAPAWIGTVLRKPDDATAHAAMHTLRRSANWPTVVQLLDRPDSDSARVVALRAIADQYVIATVDALLDRLRPGAEPNLERRRQYADLLTRVYQKPAPWTYWGYRPPPRPPNAVEWERTPQIKHAVNGVLLDPDLTVRLATLRRMQREKIPTIPDTIEAWLADERDPERVAAILDSLKEHRPTVVREMLLAVVREKEHATANRLGALAQVAEGLDDGLEQCLIDLAGALEDGPVLAAVLLQTGKRPKLGAGSLLIGKVDSPSAEVRAATAEALAQLRDVGAGEAILPLLSDRDARVRRAAADAVGKLEVQAAAESLLKLAGDTDAAVRRSSLHSLRLLTEPRVLPAAIAAANDSETALEALACIGEFGSLEHARLVVELAKRNTSADILHQAFTNLTRWGNKNSLPPNPDSPGRDIDRAVAELQGSSGVVARWTTIGPLPDDLAAQIAKESGQAGANLYTPETGTVHWQQELARPGDTNFTVGPSAAGKPGPNDFWIGTSDVEVSETTAIQFLASSSGTLRVWLNGQAIHQRTQHGSFQPDSDRFEGILTKGVNRIVIQVSAGNPPNVAYHVRFRRKSSRTEHEQLAQAALTRPGNAERGGKLFFDAEKSQCIKCHRLGDQGERIGPELTGVGNRFSRIHIIESILEPSRTLAPSYEGITVALNDGRILTGLRVAETDTTLTLVDNQAVKHVLEKSAIEERRVQPTSIMPDGLEKRFTTDEFVDLIAYLVSQKETHLARPETLAAHFSNPWRAGANHMSVAFHLRCLRMNSAARACASAMSCLSPPARPWPAAGTVMSSCGRLRRVSSLAIAADWS